MVRIDKYDRLLKIFRRLLIGEVHFIDGLSWEENFQREEQAMVVLSHGPIFGPLAWVITILPRVTDLGFGHLIYTGIAHPIVSNIPIFERIVGFQKSGGKRLTVDDYVALFKSGRLNLLSVSPEGEFSLYGNGVDIQPFRSPRALEIALRVNCPIILIVGKGFEVWQRPLDIRARWRKALVKWLALKIPFLDRLDEGALDGADTLSLTGIFQRIPHFHVYSKRYEPKLTGQELSREKETRDRQLWAEADRMRLEMMAMMEELKRKAQ